MLCFGGVFGDLVLFLGAFGGVVCFGGVFGGVLLFSGCVWWWFYAGFAWHEDVTLASIHGCHSTVKANSYSAEGQALSLVAHLGLPSVAHLLLALSCAPESCLTCALNRRNASDPSTPALSTPRTSHKHRGGA